MRKTLLDPRTKTYLLAEARRALASALGLEAPVPPRPEDPVLEDPARIFVSWHEGDRLIGCIGTLEAQRPLEEAVRYFALQAGLNDPRTPAATASQLPRLSCEISVLSAPQPLDQQGLPAIARAIEPGVDGVILRAGPRRAVFLPVVWKSLPDPVSFLLALCRKGGIDPEQTDPPITAETFRTELFED
jgi:AmmeMemoRadiSam system protein A